MSVAVVVMIIWAATVSCDALGQSRVYHYLSFALGSWPRLTFFEEKFDTS